MISFHTELNKNRTKALNHNNTTMKRNRPHTGKQIDPTGCQPLCRTLIVGALLTFAGSTTASAVFDVYVLRKGDGVAVTGSAQAHHIDHFSGSSESVSLSNSWAAPSTDPNTRITQGGSFATYSQLTPSLDGNYLTFMGRSAAVDDAVGTTDHVVGMFNLQTQSFDTTTRIPTTEVEHQSGGRGFRGGISTDGSNLWFTGRNPGVYHSTVGSNTATSVANTWEYNLIGINNGDLHVSRRAGSTHGIHRWDGLPTTEVGNMDVRFADEGSGWDNDNGQYGSFAFAGDALFVTNTAFGASDQISVFFNDGPDVWNVLDGPGQSLSDTINGVPHLAAIDMGDYVQIFYTNEGGGDNNALYSVAWDRSTQTFDTPIHLADAGEGYGFAGVVAVPEPSTYALLLGLGAMVMVVTIRRRRNRVLSARI